MFVSQCETYLVPRISELTKNAKLIFRANVKNSFQACCFVPDNTMPLSFKNQNADNCNFKMLYFESFYRVFFLKKLKKSTKNRGQKLHVCIETYLSR